MWYYIDKGGVYLLRVAICDDEEYICSALEKYVLQFCESMGIECETDIFTTGEGFIQNLDIDNSYHLIFLDIELSKCSGIDVSVHIRDVIGNESVQIAYVSGKNGYDRQLFAFRPFYFVDKPFDQNKIGAVIQKYLRIYGNKNSIFHYKIGHDNYWINLNEVLYFQSMDRKVIIKSACYSANKSSMVTVAENNPEKLFSFGKEIQYSFAESQIFDL